MDNSTGISGSKEIETLIRSILKLGLPYLRVSVTTDCNAACSFCHNEGQQHGKRGKNATPHFSKLSVQQFEELADFFRPYFDKVVITGGEPTLVRNLPEIVSVFSERGYKTHLTTNGFAFDSDLQQKIKDAGVSSVNVSLHSTVPEIHSRIFGVKTELPVILHNIGTLSKIFGSENSKINYMTPRAEFDPDELLFLANLSAKNGLIISVLSEVTSDRNLDRTKLACADYSKLVAYLDKKIGIKTIKQIQKDERTSSVYTLRDGSRWEIFDLQTEARWKINSNTECCVCSNKNICVEGPYALRISDTGVAIPCLLRKDNRLPLFGVEETNNNKQVINKRIMCLTERIHAAELGRSVIFGSSAIVLNGIDLDRRVNDLDVFVSEEDFDKLKKRFRETHDPRGFSMIEVAPQIELLKSFPGVEFKEVLKNSITIRKNVRVAALEDLAAWKRAQAPLRSKNEDKEKDAKDLTRIESVLGRKIRR